MFEKLNQSSGNVLGYKVVGTITKADYKTMLPEVEALVEQEGHIRLLLDMTEFKWEKVKAWGADWKFGHEYSEKIDKMAIVGDKKWQEWLAKVAEPFYAGEAKFYPPDEAHDAWSRLRV
ncbi:MAG: STAS/SEC14 domain-containing protein [Anaerolineales bacterium]|nr:STAS/SEC14 domain-containing protein [Anaerolineales bacterium]